MRRPSVSVIVCFYERTRHLKLCLDSLRVCRDHFDEVVITDDGSRESTVESVRNMIGAYPFTVRHVWQEKAGFRAAAARNNGIRNAHGEYLVFLDSDFVVLRGAVLAHLNYAMKGRFVAGHCKYMEKGSSDILMANGVSPEAAEELYRSLPDREIRKNHRRFLKRTILMRLHLAKPSKQSLGGHLSIYRKDIEKVNGYDENFVGWGGEDEDLGIRLVKAGIYGRSAIPRARVLHVWHPKELGGRHWKEGPNVKYFENRNRPIFCENGLVKVQQGLNAARRERRE